MLGLDKPKAGCGGTGTASDAVELLLQSDGVRDDLADATLGLEWTRLVEKPSGPAVYALESRELSKALVRTPQAALNAKLRPSLWLARECPARVPCPALDAPALDPWLLRPRTHVAKATCQPPLPRVNLIHMSSPPPL